MLNQRAVDVLVRGLTQGVTHPGDPNKDQPAKLLAPLPAFRSMGLPPGQAAHFANEANLPDSDAARVYAEALVQALQDAGVLGDADQTEIDQLRAQAATPTEADPAAPSIDLMCVHTSRILFQVAANRHQLPIDCDQLVARIAQLHA